MSFIIYHMKGIKVGCTRNFNYRTKENKKKYGDNIDMEIIEVIDDEKGIEFAGDREVYWNKHYGYKLNTHYRLSWVKLSKEQRSEIAKKGVRIQIERGEHLSNKNIGVQNFTKEQRAKHGSRGMKSQIRNGTHINQRKSVCPHCGKIGQMTIMNRWHFNRCSYKKVQNVDPNT